MAEIATLPQGLIGTPGGNISESLGEKVTRPIHERRTITNRGDIHHMAVLVYQFIQYEQAAALIGGRHACHGGSPYPLHHPPVRYKFRVSQCRLFRPGGKIIEGSQ